MQERTASSQDLGDAAAQPGSRLSRAVTKWDEKQGKVLEVGTETDNPDAVAGHFKTEADWRRELGLDEEEVNFEENFEAEAKELRSKIEQEKKQLQEQAEDRKKKLLEEVEAEKKKILEEAEQEKQQIVRTLTQTIEQHKSELDRLRAELASTEQELSQKTQALARTREASEKQLQETQHRIAEAQSALDRAVAEKKELSEKGIQTEAIKKQLEEKSAEIEGLVSNLDLAKRNGKLAAEESEQRLREEELELARLRQQVDDMMDKARLKDKDFESLQQRQAELKREREAQLQEAKERAKARQLEKERLRELARREAEKTISQRPPQLPTSTPAKGKEIPLEGVKPPAPVAVANGNNRMCTTDQNGDRQCKYTRCLVM